MFGNKFSKLSALKGKEAKDITQVDIDAVNTELTEAGITGLEVATESMMATEVETATKAIKDELATANKNLTTAQDALKVAQDELATEKAAHDKLKAKPAAKGTTVKTTASGSAEGEELTERPLTETDKKAREAYNKANPATSEN